MRYFVTFAVFLLICGCSSSDKADTGVVVMSWNVENFFDDVDNGTEYYEFDPSNGDWTYDYFSRKSSAIADLITASNPGGPDIVLLQEVENANALEHLNDNGLKASGYRYSLFLPTEGAAIGIGVLSRYPLLEVRNHSVNYGGETAGRNIAELLIELPEAEGRMRLFVNHWKSKLGGAEATEPMRMAAAGMLSDLIAQALEADGSELILAAGDFNESHDEYARTGEAYPTAIRAAGENGENPPSSMVYTPGIDRMGSDYRLLFNPWSASDCCGSYYYNGVWETIDQFFLSNSFFNGTGLEYSGFDTVRLDFNTTSGGLPIKWLSSTGTGYSDHLPIILSLELAE